MGIHSVSRNVELRGKYEALLAKGKETGDLTKNMQDLRRMVLIEGLPTDHIEVRNRSSQDQRSSQCS